MKEFKFQKELMLVNQKKKKKIIDLNYMSVINIMI